MELIEATNIVRHHSGVQQDKWPGDGCTVWAVVRLDRPLKWPENIDDRNELYESIVSAVEEVTGGDFGYYYGGPGRLFCESPTVRLIGSKALVTQFRGLDI